MTEIRVVNPNTRGRKPVRRFERIEYHRTYFLDAPKLKGDTRWTIVLLFDRVKVAVYDCGYERTASRTGSAVDFVGDTQAEVEAKLVAWVEALDADAREVDLEAQRGL